MIAYRIKLEADGTTILVKAPDFPEVITFGESREEALHHAAGALREAIAARIHDKEPIPQPSKIKKNEPFVVLPLQTEVKVRLYETMQETGVRKSELARRMKLHRQEVERILDFDQSTSLMKIESAFAALGKTLHIEVTGNT